MVLFKRAVHLHDNVSDLISRLENQKTLFCLNRGNFLGSQTQIWNSSFPVLICRGLESAPSLVWALTQQKAWEMDLEAATERMCSVAAIISLLQQGSSEGLYDLVLLKHLKSACLPIIWPCWAVMLDRLHGLFYQILSAEQIRQNPHKPQRYKYIVHIFLVVLHMFHFPVMK